MVACPVSDDGPPPRTQVLQQGEALRFSDDGVPAADGWDLRLVGWDLFLNGGESGSGLGGGIDMELLDLDMRFEELERRNQVLWFLFYDSYACALSTWWWYALDGTHTLFSNYHVYAVRRDGVDWAVQVLDYYREVEGAAVAGWPELRVAPFDGGAERHEFDLDATAGGLAPTGGPDDRWTYLRLPDTILELNDADAAVSADWDLAWKRFQVKSNSGPSGPGGVLTADFDEDRGESAEDALSFDRENQSQWFEDRLAAWDGGANLGFRPDAVQPVIRRWLVGEPGDSTLTVDPDRWFLAVDRQGGEVYKVRVTAVEGSEVAGAGSVTVEVGHLP